MDVTNDAIFKFASELKDPETGRPLGVSNQVKSAIVNRTDVQLEVGLTSFSSPLKVDFANEVELRLRSAFPSVSKVDLQIVEHLRPAQPMGRVGLTAKAVIAVGSGKGGVGKSTVALSLALALQRAGCRVGLLDADVYGPSIPQLTGVRGQVSKLGDKIVPLDYRGMPLISIGFMVPPDQAVIWRGPMLHSAVTTFVQSVDWGQLDYLIIDMPPGTGDIALSLSQLLPVTGAVIVCTPQEVALIDAIKAVAMFRQVKIPIAGVVENMSGFLCPGCNKRFDIFGKGGAREYAEQAGLPFLGEIPIHIGIREKGDLGQSAVNFDDPQIAPYLESIAYQLSKHLAQRSAQSPIAPSLPILG
jgi:ATP-binding protein involved in chromosome partitioning